MNDVKTLRSIELKAQEHRRDLDILRDRLAILEDAITNAKREHLPAIRRAVATAKGSRHRLALLIEEHAELFVKPKSREAHGLRIGFRTDRDKWLWPKMPELVARVREILGHDKAKILIHTEESIPRGRLTTELREQLRIPRISGTKRLIIEPLDGEVDKLIDTLLGDLSKEIAVQTEETS